MLSIGKLGLCCYIAASAISLILFVPLVLEEGQVLYESWYYSVGIIAIYFIILNIYLRIVLRGYHYQVSIRAAFLGTVFAAGIFMSILTPSSWHSFGWYMCCLSLFHFSEFYVTAEVNPRTLSLDSFLLNHSTAYTIAAITSWIEFWIEHYYYPDLKLMWPISLAGLLFIVGGEVLRKAAMLTARTNFNHIVQSTREAGHELVTHGVYSYCRHPSYVGWFYWSIGTQLLLTNPLCLVAYIWSSWCFFNERVLVEEVTLLNFFGEQYYQYQQKVKTGLPFIEGYKGSL